MSSPARVGVPFYAKNLGTVSAFYEQLLGATVVHSEENHRVLQTPDVQLIIHAIAPSYAEGIAISIPPVPREEQAIKPFFTVERLADAEAQVGNLGGLLCGPVWSSPGMVVRNACDPEGNIVQLRASTA